MDNAVEIYLKVAQYPRLNVLQHVVKRAVRVLAQHDQKIEALALIRGAYTDETGAYASLNEAQKILEHILASR